MIIDQSYFVGPLSIAQLSQAAVSATVNDYIDLHGNEFLIKALGQSLADAYLAGIDVGSDEVIEQRWLDLKDGILFTNQSELSRKWVGFDSGYPFPLNPVAGYVWWYLKRDGAIQMAGIGAVQAQAENAVNMSPGQPLSVAWNQMVKDVWVLHEYVLKNVAVYPEFNSSEVCGKTFKKINAFGI